MRFQILLGTMHHLPETVDAIVLTCVTLHNLLRIRKPADIRGVVDEDDNNHNVVGGQWRQAAHLQDGDSGNQRNVNSAAGSILRDYLKTFFNSDEGAVEWQENMI